MSKRLCTSLLSAPQRSQPSLPPRCSIHGRLSILRDDLPLRQHLPSKRPFTTSPQRDSGVSATRGIQGRKQSQPSMFVQIKEKQKTAQRDGSVLEHMGFLPDTYIPPTGKNLPSWFADPKGRYKVAKLKVWNFIYYLQGHFMAFWFVKPRVKLEKGKVPGIAKGLYERMYTHFARGTLTEVEGILSPGMLGSLRARIAQRTPNTGLQWTLHRYIGTPKVITYRFQVMPDGTNTDKFGFGQAVVRIRSLQSLVKTKRMRVINRETNTGSIKEAVLDDQGNYINEEDLEEYKLKVAKVTTEYLVVQRMVRHSRPGEWHVWGTAEELRMADVRGQKIHYLVWSLSYPNPLQIQFPLLIHLEFDSYTI